MAFGAATTAASPSDFDGDGKSDFTSVEILPDGALQFRARSLESNTLLDLGSLGTSGNHLSAAKWLEASKTTVGTVAQSGEALQWSVQQRSGETTTKPFGRAADTVVSGADLNGNGVADAVVVRASGRRLSWEVAYDFFSTTPSAIALSFGFSNEIPLFIRGVGVDALASLSISPSGATALRIFNTQTGKARRFRLVRAPLASRPHPLLLSATTTGLAYTQTSSTSTNVYYQTLNPSQVAGEVVINASGTVVVGDFLPSEGEEVAVHSGTTLFIHDRASNSVVEKQVDSGIAFDEININSFSSTTPPGNNGGGSPPSAPPPVPTPSTPPVPPSDPQLSQVCAGISPIAAGEMLIKSEPSNHIGRHDPRTLGYTVVCAAQCPANLRYAQFFYSNGEFAGAVAKYGLFSGNGKPRMYGAVGQAPVHDSIEIARKAQGIGNGKLYLQISADTSGASTQCKEFAPRGRNGSL